MKLIQPLVSVVFLLLLSGNTALAQSAPESEMEAKNALQRFLDAWNSADNSAIQMTLNYPHITHGPTGLIVAHEPAQFVTDFDELRKQGWSHSQFNGITTRQASEAKVNFEVEYSRHNAAGEVISRGYVFYVVTKQDAHWGMQYRAPGQLPSEIDNETRRATEQAAKHMVNAFFLAFNAADNVALLNVSHVPQIMLSAGQFIFAKSIDSPIVTMNFERMRERENWQRSAVGDYRVLNASSDQVIVELSFERYDPNGRHYLSGPAVWVLTKREGVWGVEFRSLMPPSRHLM